MPLTRTNIEPPTLTDFGLTEDAVSSSREIVSRVERRLGMLVFGFGGTLFVCFFGYALLACEWDFVAAVVGSAVLGTPLATAASIALAVLLIPISRWTLRHYAQAQHVLKRFQEFDKALKAYEQEQRRRETAYWMNLSPRGFEHEVAFLFIRLGMNAYVTPRSGDKGIDVYITSDDLRAIVQCKRYKNRV